MHQEGNNSTGNKNLNRSLSDEDDSSHYMDDEEINVEDTQFNWFIYLLKWSSATGFAKWTKHRTGKQKYLLNIGAENSYRKTLCAQQSKSIRNNFFLIENSHRIFWVDEMHKQHLINVHYMHINTQSVF